MWLYKNRTVSANEALWKLKVSNGDWFYQTKLPGESCAEGQSAGCPATLAFDLYLGTKGGGANGKPCMLPLGGWPRCHVCYFCFPGVRSAPDVNIVDGWAASPLES